MEEQKDDNKTPIDVSEAVEALVAKAKDAGTADDALKYSQAASNVAHTMRTVREALSLNP